MHLKNSSYIKTLFIPLLLSSNLFSAQSGLYLELGAGLGLEDTLKTKNIDYKHEDGFVGSGAIGYQYNSFSAEIEAKYQQDSLYSTSYGEHSNNIAVDGDLIQSSQMLNFYYSGYNTSKLVSSIGLGVGITQISLEDVSELGSKQEDRTDKGVLSLQGMFSVGYMFTEHVTLLAKYTYFQTTSSDNFESNGDNLFSLNLRYLF